MNVTVTHLQDASRINIVWKEAWTRVRTDARNSTRWYSSWNRVPMMENTAKMKTPVWAMISSRLSSSRL